MYIRVPLAALLACSLLPAAASAAASADPASKPAPAPRFHPLRRDPHKRAGESLKPDLRQDSGLPPVVVEVVAHYNADGTTELRCDGGHPVAQSPLIEHTEAQR